MNRAATGGGGGRLPADHELSVVIPLYNEAENVDDLHGELTRSLEPLGRPTS